MIIDGGKCASHKGGNSQSLLYDVAISGSVIQETFVPNFSQTQSAMSQTSTLYGFYKCNITFGKVIFLVRISTLKDNTIVCKILMGIFQ